MGVEIFLILYMLSNLNYILGIMNLMVWVSILGLNHLGKFVQADNCFSSSCTFQLAFSGWWFQSQVYFKVFACHLDQFLLHHPVTSMGTWLVVNCTCSSVLKVLGSLFRLWSLHTQVREILGVDKKLYGVAFLRSSLYFPGPWAFSPALVARKLGFSFFTLSYLFATVPTSGFKKREDREERNQWEFVSHSSLIGG